MNQNSYSKITDLICSNSFKCSLYLKKNKHWLRIKLGQNKYLFYLISQKNLLDFLSGKINISGLFFNSPDNTYVIQHKLNFMDPKSKIDFNYKAMPNWNKFYTDFKASELSQLNKYVKNM